MRTLEELLALKAARFEALRMDRVVGVGIGPQTAKLTPENYDMFTETLGDNSLVIFVTSPEVLPAVEGAMFGSDAWCAVPSGLNVHEVPDAPTDEMTLNAEIERSKKVVVDDDERTHLLGGIQLLSEYDVLVADQLDATKGDPQNDKANGTLCCLVRTTDTERIAALTCHHVLLDPKYNKELINDDGKKKKFLEEEFTRNTRVALGKFSLVVRNDRPILQHVPPGASLKDVFNNRGDDGEPRGSRSDNFKVGHPTSNNSSCCKDVIGRFLKSEYDRQVDAGLVLLREPITEFFLAPEAICPEADVSDYRAEVLGSSGDEDSPVAITGVADLALAELQEQGTDGKWRLSGTVTKYGIRTKFSTGIVRCIEYTDNVVEDATGAPSSDRAYYIFPYDTANRKVAEDAFGRAGDSGCAVMRNGKVVAMMARGVSDKTFGRGLRSMGVPIGTITTRLNIEVFLTDNVTHKVPAGNFAGQPGLAPRFGPRSQATLERLRRVVPEIRRLILHDRRSQVTWHRNGGPRLVGDLFWAAAERTGRVRSSVRGRAAAECIDEIIGVLSVRGSKSLKRDLEALQPLLRMLPGATVGDLIGRVEGP